MKSEAKSVTEYLKALPEVRRKAIQTVRKAIRAGLPAGNKETMQYGMIRSGPLSGGGFHPSIRAIASAGQEAPGPEMTCPEFPTVQRLKSRRTHQ